MLNKKFLKLTFRVAGINFESIRPIWKQPKVLLSSSSQRTAKVFAEGENKYAHDVLANSLNSYQIFRFDMKMSPIDVIPEGITAIPDGITAISSSVENAASQMDQIQKDFQNLMIFCNKTQTCISDEKFIQFVKLFCQLSSNLSDKQLFDCLAYLTLLPQTESVNTRNFCDLWETFDRECSKRMDSWDINRLLMICDAWYSLKLARLCDFVHHALRKLSRRVKRMTLEQLVHSMFLCNIVRKPIGEMFDYEIAFEIHIDKMSLEEIGVMSMGFFKTQTPIRNPAIIEKIFLKLMNGVQSVEDITLVSILKILRYSSKLAQVNLMTELLDKLCPEIERVSLLSCIHIALLGGDIQHSHDRIIELIVNRFNRDLDQARLKDMERIAHIISLFNYQSPDGADQQLCAKILDKLETKLDEILKHPRCFSNCLHFLSMKGKYNEEMISSVLDQKFIHHTYSSKLPMAREIFSLDSFVKINLKDNYVGNQLSEKHRRSMGKLMTDYIPVRNGKFKLSVTDRFLLEIKETTDKILPTMTTFKHVLPHFQRPDIVFCYDKSTGEIVPISPDCPEDYKGIILTRAELLGNLENVENIETIAIVIAGWNNVVRDKERYTGPFQMKLDQLALLGYHFIVIAWHEWHQLESVKDRHNLMERKLARYITGCENLKS